MKVMGVDFTSAPGHGKPIAVAAGQLVGGELRITSLRELTNFPAFDDELRSTGPWLAGMDFPFGLPARLLRALEWPTSWPVYVNKIWDMGKTAFESEIQRYRDNQPKGDKHHKRDTDRQAGGTSPMNVVRPPVGKMFFEGAYRILRSDASIVPCATNGGSRVILEVYPALVAKAFVGNKPYKEGKHEEDKQKRRQTRANIVSALSEEPFRQAYGCSVKLSEADKEQMIEDPKADFLDAVLCAAQAAWASSQPNYGIPSSCNKDEGWIVDPSQLREKASSPRVEKLLDRITTDPSICHGQPCLRGLRYPVDTILDLLSSGMTTQDILADYNDLEPEDLSAALAFAARLRRVKGMQALAT